MTPSIATAIGIILGLIAAGVHARCRLYGSGLSSTHWSLTGVGPRVGRVAVA